MTRLNEKAYGERLGELGSSESYLLQVPSAFINDHPDAEAFKMYLRREWNADLSMIYDGDTVQCAFAHLESGPSIGPFQTMLIGFDVIPSAKDRILVWDNARGFFESPMVFKFPSNAFASYTRLVTLNALQGS